MSTVFIALQCFQCSTMQVKQQKKSSNKWTCVVCNEKQSVRKVFAQGFMATDVRKFVQTFNMSRQFAQQQQQQQCANETLDPVLELTDNQPQSNHRKRSDWSEYIDPKDDHDSHEEDEKEDLFGPRIVTKFPRKALYKKPKLDTDSSGFGSQDGEKGFGPVFVKRNSHEGKEPKKFDSTSSNWASKRFDFTSQAEEGISAVKGQRWSLAKGDSSLRTYAKQQVENGFAESRAWHPTTARVSSTKCGDYIIHGNNEDSEDKGPPKCQLSTMKRASKWDNYITEDDDDESDLCLKIGREFADHKEKWDDCVFDATIYDQSVEEDIHPDFL